jgi:PAS domain S-box-containing protein
MTAPVSYYGPEDLEKTEAAIHQIIDEGTGTIELELICKDGRKIPTEYRVSTINDDQGMPKYMISIGRDLTERKKAEEEHLVKERTIAQSLSGIALSNMKGKIFYANDALVDMIGLKSAHEIIGKSYMDFITLEKETNIHARMHDVMVGKGWRGENTFKKKDGTEAYMHLSINLVKDAIGTPICLSASFEDITERKKAEEALQDSEKKYREVIENANEAIFIAQDGVFKFSNGKTQEMIGYSDEELSSKPFSELIHPDDREMVIDRHVRRIKGEDVPSIYSFRIIDKAGMVKWVDINAVAVEWEEKPATLNFLNDITERKQMEIDLEESEKRYKVLIEKIPSVIWMSAEDGKTIFISPNVEKFYGYSSSEILERGEELWLGRIHEDDLERVVDAFTLLFSENRRYEVEYRIRRKDGQWIWLHDQADVIEDIGGELFAYGVFSDITDRKRAEGEMQKLATVVKFSSELVNLATLDGKMIFMNEAGGKMLGIEPNELGNVNIMEVIPDHLTGMVEEELLPALMAGGSWEGDLQYRNLKTGELTDVHAMTFMIKDHEKGVPLCLANVSLDITERKKAEDQIVRSLHEKELLLKELYHRTKNNMQVINAMLELRSMETDDEQVTIVFNEMKNKIMSMALVHEKLYQSEDLSNIDVSDYIKDLVSLLFRSYTVSPEKITVDLEIDPLPISIDSAIPFGQIINELISNSLKHAFPKGRNGRISIRLKSTEPGIVECHYSDNGVGMPDNTAINELDSFGIQSIIMIVELQLKGKIEISNENGLTYSIRFNDDLFQSRL